MNNLLFIILLELLLILYLFWPSSESFQNNIPIDIVYTWVNGDDPQWINKKETFLKKDIMKPEGLRYKNINELKYSLRSIQKYAPWVRNIFIVVDDIQKPDFISDKVKIIKHSEIIDQKYLPTFSSHTIEANLHKIPNLSQYFLYFNDDSFLGSPLSKSDILSPQGKPYYFPAKLPLNGYFGIAHGICSWTMAWENNYKVLKKLFPKKNIPGMWHQTVLIDKNQMFELQDKLKLNYLRTCHNRFRNYNDNAFIGLCYVYQYLNNKAVLGNKPTNEFLDFQYSSPKTLMNQLNKLKEEKTKFYCLNNIKQDSKIVPDILTFLNEMYPNPSKYEENIS
jgi:hypothetical protein